MTATDPAEVARNLRMLRCPMAPHAGTLSCACGYRDTALIKQLRDINRTLRDDTWPSPEQAQALGMEG